MTVSTAYPELTPLWSQIDRHKFNASLLLLKSKVISDHNFDSNIQQNIFDMAWMENFFKVTAPFWKKILFQSQWASKDADLWSLLFETFTFQTANITVFHSVVYDKRKTA